MIEIIQDAAPRHPFSFTLPGVPRIAINELKPGEFWVLVNFPGRSSLTLCTTADLDLATEIMETARLVAREALAYAGSLQTRDGQDAPPFPNCDCGRPVIYGRGCTGCRMHPLDCGCQPVGNTSPATQGGAE
jgi:hypothetical protein